MHTINVDEMELLEICKERMLTEWEFINLQKIAPKWKFVFRGRK
jgi:hypothetical protein